MPALASTISSRRRLGAKIVDYETRTRDIEARGVLCFNVTTWTSGRRITQETVGLHHERLRGNDGRDEGTDHLPPPPHPLNNATEFPTPGDIPRASLHARVTLNVLTPQNRSAPENKLVHSSATAGFGTNTVQTRRKTDGCDAYKRLTRRAGLHTRPIASTTTNSLSPISGPPRCSRHWSMSESCHSSPRSTY